jgi:hypothetical protein
MSVQHKPAQARRIDRGIYQKKNKKNRTKKHEGSQLVIIFV